MTGHYALRITRTLDKSGRGGPVNLSKNIMQTYTEAQVITLRDALMQCIAGNTSVNLARRTARDAEFSAEICRPIMPPLSWGHQITVPEELPQRLVDFAQAHQWPISTCGDNAAEQFQRLTLLILGYGLHKIGLITDEQDICRMADLPNIWLAALKTAEKNAAWDRQMDADGEMGRLDHLKTEAP